MRKIATLFLSLLLCVAALAQQQRDNKGQPRFDPKAFDQKLEGFISEKAGFSEKESQAFFKLYNEMRDKQRQQQKEINDLKKPAASGDTDAEMSKRVLRIAELEAKSANIKTEYYKKLAKVVPGKKLHKAIVAEDMFHRELLRRAGGQGQQRQHRQQGNNK